MWKGREMLVGTIRCQHWCSDCCGLAEYKRTWQGKCASYLSEKRCLCSKLSVWSHSNFVCLSTFNLSSCCILSQRCLVRAEHPLSALPRGALHVAGCCSTEDARWWCEQLNSSCWTVVPESCPHPPSPRRVNLFHLLAVIPSQAGCSAEPRHAALASGRLIPRCEEMLHLLFLVVCLGRGIQALK